MALPKLTANLNTHQSQPDQPSLTSEELKQLWDEAPNEIKAYINDILTVELDRLIESKVTKITGKDLSTNDYTDEEKLKLSKIAEEANKYTHPTDAGNRHIPSGGSSGKILRWGANGQAVWGDDKDTTYSVASQSTNGLMSAYDKAKIDGVASGSTRNIIRTGTANPSGGSNGDIYIQYF